MVVGSLAFVANVISDRSEPECLISGSFSRSHCFQVVLLGELSSSAGRE